MSESVTEQGKLKQKPYAVFGIGSSSYPRFCAAADLVDSMLVGAGGQRLAPVQKGACCAVLCCAVLCCAVLSCAVLRCAALSHAVLCCAVPRCAVLCCAVLCCAVLCCAVLCCTAHMCCQVQTACCLLNTVCHWFGFICWLLQCDYYESTFR